MKNYCYGCNHFCCTLYITAEIGLYLLPAIQEGRHSVSTGFCRSWEKEGSGVLPKRTKNGKMVGGLGTSITRKLADGSLFPGTRVGRVSNEYRQLSCGTRVWVALTPRGQESTPDSQVKPSPTYVGRLLLDCPSHHLFLSASMNFPRCCL